MNGIASISHIGAVGTVVTIAAGTSPQLGKGRGRVGILGDRRSFARIAKKQIVLASAPRKNASPNACTTKASEHVTATCACFFAAESLHGWHLAVLGIGEQVNLPRTAAGLGDPLFIDMPGGPAGWTPPGRCAWCARHRA